MEQIMEKLSKERPFFHSEADFQHALAWKIHEKHPDFKIRLEKREEGDGTEIYPDISIEYSEEHKLYKYFIELKYKTKGAEIEYKKEEDNKEKFHFKNQGAQDCGRYDFLKDVQRLESLIKKYPEGMGYAIFLTNDYLYWENPKHVNTVDREFRIHDGVEIGGELKWKKGASEGTKKGREKTIKLHGNYKMKWREYSKDDENNIEFNYLLVEIGVDRNE